MRYLLTVLLINLMMFSCAGADVLYTVREGDTIEKLADLFQVEPKDILESNELSGSVLEAGSILLVPQKELAVTSLTPESVSLTPPAPKPEVVVARQTPTRTSLSSRGSGQAAKLLATARGFIGVPYLMGGTTSRAFDCSGFVMRVFQMHGISLPRTADVQFGCGASVARGAEIPGDLVFFETYLPGASHVGIYVGNGKFIHASSSKGVTITNLNGYYFGPRYLGAKRVLR